MDGDGDDNNQAPFEDMDGDQQDGGENQDDDQAEQEQEIDAQPDAQDDMEGDAPDILMDSQPAADQMDDGDQLPQPDDQDQNLRGQQEEQPQRMDDQQIYGGIDPNQQINNDFLGSNNQPMGQMDYGDEVDGSQVNANGMFNGARAGMGGEEENEDVEEYFDDAGDVGYLPADHVSTKLIS